MFGKWLLDVCYFAVIKWYDFYLLLFIFIFISPSGSNKRKANKKNITSPPNFEIWGTLIFLTPTCPPTDLQTKCPHWSHAGGTCRRGAQVLAKGLLIGEHPYLNSGWNVMDGFLVFISLVDIAFVMLSETQSPRIFGILRVFRLLRTLRPLRHVQFVTRLPVSRSGAGDGWDSCDVRMGRYRAVPYAVPGVRN